MRIMAALQTFLTNTQGLAYRGRISFTQAMPLVNCTSMVIRSSIRIWLQKSVFLMKPMMSSPSGCSQVSTRHLTLILQFGIHPFPWVAMGCVWFSTEGWTRLDWGKLSVYTNDSNRTGCTHTLHMKMNVGFRGFRVTLGNFGSL